MNYIKYVAFLLLFLSFDILHAHKTVTHEEIARKGFELSILGDEKSDVWSYLSIEPDKGIEINGGRRDIGDPNLLSVFSELLLFGLDATEFTNFRISGRKEIKSDNTPLVLIRGGAHFEDERLRFCTHFYDARNDRPLEIDPLLDSILARIGCAVFSDVPGVTSPDWALEDESEIFPRTQKFSYSDANDYYFNALTASDENERSVWQTIFFRSFGHVLHHIGDMSQPQHVRNDAHLTSSDTWFEVYTGGLTQGPFFEKNNIPPDSNLQNVFLATFDGYPPVVLSNPRRYWATSVGEYDGFGLAEFTNREFVSKDTNFGMLGAVKYSLPSINEPGATQFTVQDVIPVFQQFNLSVPALCSDPASPCAMDFLSTAITDNLRPGEGRDNVYSSTESIFNAEIRGYNADINSDPLSTTGGLTVIEERWILNKINFWSSYPFLFSRASGYSAGLINHFFRGKLKVNAPEDGIIAIIDQSSALTPGTGFEKIKLQIKNETPDIIEEGSGLTVEQRTNGGVLVAVAKFKRNLCYQPDLSGEVAANVYIDSELEWYLQVEPFHRSLEVRSAIPGATGFKEFGRKLWRPTHTVSESIDRLLEFKTFNGQDQLDCISPEYEYVSSKEFSVSGDQLEADEGLDVIFDFSETPIPLDASFNLEVSVVYKGALGEETSAVAVGQRDISEPTYFSVVNSSDVFQQQNEIFVYPMIYLPTETDSRFRAYVDPEPMLNVSVTLDGKEVAYLDSLSRSSFSRIAMLLDLGENPNPLAESGGVRSYRFQYDFQFPGGRDLMVANGGIVRLGIGPYCGEQFGQFPVACDVDSVDFQTSPTINGFYEFASGGSQDLRFSQYHGFRGWRYTDRRNEIGDGAVHGDPETFGRHLLLRRSVFLKSNYFFYEGLHPFYDGGNSTGYPENTAVVPGVFYDDFNVMPVLDNKDNPTPFLRLHSLE